MLVIAHKFLLFGTKFEKIPIEKADDFVNWLYIVVSIHCSIIVGATSNENRLVAKSQRVFQFRFVRALNFKLIKKNRQMYLVNFSTVATMSEKSKYDELKNSSN